MARRIDLLYSPPKEYAFAILYFTGSQEFNTVMRQHALDMGYTLNEHGISTKQDGIKGDLVTTTEFKIVEELAKRPGMIKERALLMDVAYREDTDIEDRTIDSHVKRIRKKFKKVDSDFSAIETRYGSGYRWNVK